LDDRGPAAPNALRLRQQKGSPVRNKQRAADTPQDAERTLPSAEFALPPAEEFHVPYLPEASGVAKDKEIHPRRSAPPVPDAPERSESSPGHE
jgi:hypothetical protein